MVYADRLPPHDVDAEDSVIGSILIDSEALPLVSAILKASDFYTERNKWCFEAAEALASRREAINQVTVAHELSLQGKLETLGGPAYLSRVVMVVPTSVHVEHYARIVQRTSVMRQLIRIGGEIAAIGYESGPDAEEAVNRAEESLYKVRTGRGAGGFIHIRDVLDRYMEEQSAAHDPDFHHLAPVQSGYTDIDKLLGGGLQRSDLIIIAARPGVGKSTLMFNMARNAAAAGNSVGLFSLEMSAQQIAIRLLASEANLDSYMLRLGLLSDEQEERKLNALGMLSDMPIYIDDTPMQTLASMRSNTQRLKTEYGLDLLVVDYIQLMSLSNRVDNRVQELSEISRSLKGMARDLEVPLLAASQLSRAIEQRPNHRPLLSDLRESGSIEQDADIVAFIYREDAYTTREEWEAKNPTDPYPENIAEIIFAKHRNGPVGTVPLFFRSDLVRFENATLDHPISSIEYV